MVLFNWAPSRLKLKVSRIVVKLHKKNIIIKPKSFYFIFILKTNPNHERISKHTIFAQIIFS